MFDIRAFTSTLRRNLREIVEQRKDPEEYARRVTSTEEGPNHIPEELKNLPEGTILFLPGSPDRAEEISREVFTRTTAEYTDNGRAFYLYVGEIEYDGGVIPVASMPSQMGIPNTEISGIEAAIEANLGAVIRVGTSGSMSEKLNAGDIVIADSASYGYLEAIGLKSRPGKRYKPNPLLLLAMQRAGRILEKEQRKIGDNIQIVQGPMYSKLELYLDEFMLFGKLAAQLYVALNKSIKAGRGYLVSEMEAARLFKLEQQYRERLGKDVRTGAFCLAIGKVRGLEEIGFIPKAKKEGMPKMYKMARYTAIELHKLRCN